MQRKIFRMGGHVSTLEEELTEVELEHLKVSLNTKNYFVNTYRLLLFAYRPKRGSKRGK